MSILTRLAACLALVLTVSGCMPNLMEEADRPAASKDEIILVGKIIISPEIPQHFGTGMRDGFGIGRKQSENRIGTAFSVEPYKKQGNWLYGKETRSLPLAQTFFITVPRATLYLQEGIYMTHAGDMSPIRLPGGFKTRMPANADVAYVGTLTYRRGDFYEITGVSVRDDYSRTVSEIRAKYGSDVSIGKALLRRF